MALTLANAITEVRYLINESTASFWTDAEITDYLEEGTRVACSKGLLWERTASIPLVASQLSYEARWQDTFTAATSDVCTVAPAHDFMTGAGPLWVSSSTTLPAGLSASTDYYLAKISETTFKLSTTRANAIAGTYVDITDTGTGTHTIYTHPSDCAEIISAYYTNTAGGAGNYKGLIKISPMKIGNLATSAAGIPKYYALSHKKLHIWPLPTAAVVTAGGVITIIFAGVTDDVAQLDNEYQHLPILYATAKCKQKDQKFAEANNLFQQFYSDLAFEREDKINREEDAFGDFQIQAGSQQGGRGRAQQ